MQQIRDLKGPFFNKIRIKKTENRLYRLYRLYKILVLHMYNNI